MLHRSGNGVLPVLYLLYIKHKGGRHADIMEFLPKHLIMPGLSTTEQVTKASKELLQIIKNPRPKNTFNIKVCQSYAIDRLATLFNNIKTKQPNKPNTKVVPR